ncbi:MAG: hypothetical protein ABSD98_02960 [Candidatus Korobacteraceae bacterium]|jgi:hypothetical protein
MNGKSMYQMNEEELRSLIGKLRARDPNSMEGRQEASVLVDAEQLLREMVEKRNRRSPSFDSEDIILDPEKEA